MAFTFSSPVQFTSKSKDPGEQLKALGEGVNQIASNPKVQAAAKYAQIKARESADYAMNALQQAFKGALDWATPPPLSPLQEKPATGLFQPGGIKQAVNNVVAIATMRPELMRKFPVAVASSQSPAVPTITPTAIPTATPTMIPTAIPTMRPTGIPTPYPTVTPVTNPSPNWIQQLFGPKTTPTPTPTAMPTPTPTPSVTPYPTPIFSRPQQVVKQELIDYGIQAGLQNPELMAAIGQNEASLTWGTPPNLNGERSYGMGGINLNAHPEVTPEQANDPNFAKNFMANRLKTAERLYPGDINRQILYYNTPGLAITAPEKLPYRAVWYLVNAMKTLGQIPSEEYLPIAQQYGFYK